MSKETLGRKMKIVALFVLGVFLMLVIALFVLTFLVGLYITLFAPEYPIWAYIVSLLIIVGLIVVFGYALSKVTEKLDEYRPQGLVIGFEITRETAKQVAYFSIGLAATILFYFGLTTYFNLFPSTISAPLIIEILKVVIQTNGFLIGLSGIVFAQMFWAIHNQMCDIQTEILNCEKNAQKQTHKSYLKKLDRKRTTMILYMFCVIAFFVISILTSLSGMAQTEIHETLPSNPNLTIPFLFLTFGIVIFMIFIVQSKISIQEKENGEAKKKEN